MRLPCIVCKTLDYISSREFFDQRSRPVVRIRESLHTAKSFQDIYAPRYHPSMASAGEPLNRNPFHSGDQGFNSNPPKIIPILPSSTASASSSGEPMDTSQNGPAPMGPPALSSPNGDRANEQHSSGQNEQHQSTTNGTSSQPVGAAAAAQQPKVVQTAFIHKLYK